MDGKNLMPLYASKKPISWRDRFYYEHMVPIKAKIPMSAGFRSLQYKYLIYPESPGKYEELYDLKVDPDELNNLALSDKHGELLLEMRKEFARMKAEIKR